MGSGDPEEIAGPKPSMKTKLDLKYVLSREIMKFVFPKGHSDDLKFIPCAMSRFVSADFSKENLMTRLNQLGCD